MYKDKEEQKAASKERSQRYRDRKKGVTLFVTPSKNVTPFVESVTKSVTPKETGVIPILDESRYRFYKAGLLHDMRVPEEAGKYPAVLHALTDSRKRAKMVAICESLNHEINGIDGRKVNLLGEVRYGMEGPTLDVVSKWLDVTA